MTNYSRLMDAIASYRPSADSLLYYLRYSRELRGDRFCIDPEREEIQQYFEDEFWGTYTKEVPRDDDGCILVDEALAWTKREMNDFYVQGELAPFVRTMRRTEAIREELLAAVRYFTGV